MLPYSKVKDFVRSLIKSSSAEERAFESGRQLGYEEGMRVGLEMKARRSLEVSEEEYMETMRYLVSKELEFVYSTYTEDPRASGLILRKSYPHNR